MIVAERKPLEEILAGIGEVSRVMVLGCRGCVTVCNAGGEKEVAVLSAALKLARNEQERPLEVVEENLERQCDPEYVQPLLAKIQDVDLVLSMACGAGVQLVAETLPRTPVLPLLNTVFIGVAETRGIWGERCQACGDCKLATTGGICPVTRCSKSILNGPCGGSTDGHCEIASDVACGWQLIVDRLEALDQLDLYEKLEPPADWSNSRDGGPRKIEREDLK